MTDTAERKSGHCLCGAVTFSVGLRKHEVGVCHCEMCRRWTAGPFLAAACDNDVEVGEGAPLAFYQSSDWGERGFCQACGTPLFWRTRDKSHTAVSVSALDDPGPLRFTSEIFIDEKPDYYEFANETKTMTGEQVFAYYTDKTDH